MPRLSGWNKQKNEIDKTQYTVDFYLHCYYGSMKRAIIFTVRCQTLETNKNSKANSGGFGIRVVTLWCSLWSICENFKCQRTFTV